MSGTGQPALAVPRCENLRLGIAASRWHERITTALLDRASAAAAEAGIVDPTVVRVPGAVELPVVCQALARQHDAVVALGVVIRGDTPHFEYVCQAATEGLMQVGVSTGVPVGFGVLTCDNDPQALDRAGLPDSREDKGYEATQAALSTLAAVRQLG